MRTFKTAIIGCGTISERKHIPSAIKLPEIELIALVDQNIERAKNLSNHFGVERYFQDFKDVLGLIDIAIVATPNSSHSKITGECLRRRIHVLCEKPMATSVEECQSMINASESGHAKLMIGHYMRYTSNLLITKQLVKDKIIKNIRTIECTSGYVFHWPSVSNFYDSYEMSGGGVLIDFGVHLVDLIYWLTGQESTLLSYRVKDTGTSKIEKDVEVELEQANGPSCTIILSRTKKLSNTLQINGDNGWLKVYLDNYQNLDLYKPGKLCSNGKPISIIGEKCDPYLNQLQDFLECILEDRSPSISGCDGLRTMKFVEACYKFYSN